MSDRRAPPGGLASRARFALATAALAASLALPTVAASTECPPQPTPPSAEQIAEAQQEARDRGFLWRIRKGQHTSYLYGTVHLGKFEWVPPGPTVRQALRAAQVLALELDLSDPATRQRLRAAQARQPSDAAVAPALRASLAQEATRACLPPRALHDTRPALQALTLVVLAARWEGLDTAYAQEAVLGAFARSRQLPIVALETVDRQMAALLPETPEQTDRFIEQALAQIRSGAARRASRRLAQAWADGRLRELASYEQWCECVTGDEDRQLLRRLNDERNPALASGIERLHAQGQVVFAAVGALHMIGPRALPLLLQRLGFEVERVEFTR